jgi:Tfp pilus assembly protein PilO
MTGLLDKLNLRPSEKRLVVVVGTALFVVLNWWFVFPHFSDWARVQARMEKARRTLVRYQHEIANTNSVARAVKQMENEGYAVPPEEQFLHFASTREAVARQAGVNISQTSKIATRTNQFFLELTQNISLQTKESELVNFLYSLGSSNSLIRVRDLSLRPDAPRHHLNATVKLAASYQKKQTGRAPVAKTQARARAANDLADQ